MSLVMKISRSSRWTSLGALFFALTGVLAATSIVNAGDSGLGFYYLVFGVVFASLPFPSGWLPWLRVDSESLKAFAFVGTVATLLLATTVLHVIWIQQEARSEIVHLVSRLAFLGYFVVAQAYLQGEMLTKTLLWLRRSLMVICAYGVYQIPAKLLGFPLFLDWLRNNRSLLMYDYNEAGWVNLVRANSIYAEPSQAAVPMVVLFILNVYVRTSKASRIFGWTVLVLFGAVSFSRTAWVALAMATIALLLARSSAVRNVLLTKHFALIVAFLVALLLLPFWAVIGANGDADLSAQERSAGIVLGINTIKDAPILGHGWNSFKDIAEKYSDVPLAIDPEIEFTFIHNMVISYFEQAGLAGFLLAALPFILIILWSTGPPWMSLVTLLAFLFAAEFGNDIGYYSLTWLWIALLINMKCADSSQSVKVEKLNPWQRPYRDQMSVLPSSPS